MLLDKLRVLGVVTRAVLSLRAPSSQLSLQVTRREADLYRHLNNARYLSFMDLGRWDLTLRSGMAAQLFRDRLSPVAVQIEIEYRRELPLGQAFILDTRWVEVIGKTLVCEQLFLVGDRVHARAQVRVLLRGASGVAAPSAYRVFVSSRHRLGGPRDRG